jgi:lactoylglutathione lyase
MKLNLMTIHVADLAASLRFYHVLMGLPMVRRFSAKGIEIAMLGENDQPQLELIGDGAPAGNGAGLSVGLKTDDLDEAMAALKDQGVSFGEIISPGPYVRFALTRDPDGTTVQILEEA